MRNNNIVSHTMSNCFTYDEFIKLVCSRTQEVPDLHRLTYTLTAFRGFVLLQEQLSFIVLSFFIKTVKLV